VVRRVLTLPGSGALAKTMMVASLNKSADVEAEAIRQSSCRIGV